MPNPYFEWAFDASQNTPAQLVSNDHQEIDALVGGSHSRGVYQDGFAINLNGLDVYPTVRIDNNPDPLFFERSSETTVYISGDGGTLYQITGVFTELPLTTQKASALPVADAQFQAFFVGGFFFDDGGGSVLYGNNATETVLYTEAGVQSNMVGAAFTISIRDAADVLHNFNSAQFQDFFEALFNHTVQAFDELETAVLSIASATNVTEIQAALDAMSPPNNTL